ncbi:MAG TPA: carboxymuconolactone decarboxylase family protein [Acidimicrobiales bacterium]
MAEVDTDQLFREILTSDPPKWTGPYPCATRDHLFGEVWARPGLSRRDRRLISLACVSSASIPIALESHVYSALLSGDIGLDELLEAVLQFAVYNGWARASFFEGIVRMQWVRVCQERGEEIGEWPEPPAVPIDLDDHAALVEAGERTYVEVLGTEPQPRGRLLQETGVLGFVYARVWGRETLPRRDRRLLTLPWVALNGGPATISRHVAGALTSGDLSTEELEEVVLQTSAYGGLLVGERLDDALRAATESRT